MDELAGVQVGCMSIFIFHVCSNSYQYVKIWTYRLYGLAGPMSVPQHGQTCLRSTVLITDAPPEERLNTKVCSLPLRAFKQRS